MIKRIQSAGEEAANSVIHGLALLSTCVGTPFLVTTASHLGLVSAISAGIFAATMVLVFLTSTIYHALPRGHGKRIFLKLDHGAIYFFIAGSYTPFALSHHVTWQAWTLLGLVWSLAVFGAMLKAFDRLSHPWLSTGLYLVMGWLVLLAAIPLVGRMPQASASLLMTGGLAYTVGVVFYLLDSRLRYSHAVWHTFVTTGSACHFFAVLNFMA